MALVNPNIAMSYRGIELPQQNALADYAAIQQIQGGRQAQELNALKMQEAQRAEAKDISRTNALAQAGTDDTAIANALLKSGDLKGYLDFLKSRTEQSSASTKLLSDKLALLPNAYKMADTPEAYLALHQSVHTDPVLGPWLKSVGATPEKGLATLQNAVETGKFNDLRMKSMQSVSQLLEGMKPTTDVSSMQALGFPTTPAGYAQFRAAQLAPPAPSDIAKLIKERDALPPNSPNRALYDREIADRGAVAENARKRLEFDKYKFNWEKANPGFELREADDGSVVGVNKRTLQAFPVTVGGGAAPAAAPAAGGTGMPSARVPAAQAPVAGATPTAGKPLMGRPKEAPAKFNDTDLQLSGLAGSLKEFKQEVAKNVFTGAKFIPSGQDTARMQAKYTALLMGVKDLYTLGALTGPDMSIIESQITNPASWSGKFTTKEGFEAQTKVIEDMLKRTAVNVESTYSRVPKATKKALSDLDSGAGSENDPLGLLKGN